MLRKALLPQSLHILWSDEHYVAVMKPAGLATIPGRGEVDSVLEALGERLELATSGQSDPRLRVVHRIDKDTSGLVIFAKHKDAQRHLSHQFQNNLVDKQYVALVAGTPTDERGEIDAPIAVHPATKKRMTVSKHGRPSRTLWQIESRFRGLSLLRVFPKTGKTHQIRVHLKHAGLPLAVDRLYNPSPPARGAKGPGVYLSTIKRGYQAKRGEEETPLIDRLTLHAEALGFAAPDGSRVRLECPLPKDFRAALNQLRKHALR